MLYLPRIFAPLYIIYVRVVHGVFVLMAYYCCDMVIGGGVPILRAYHYAVVSQILYNFFSDFFIFFAKITLRVLFLFSNFALRIIKITLL